MSITRTIQTNLNTHELRTLLGEYNKHIKYIQERLEVQITQRQDQFIITGELDLVERTEIIINKLVELAGEQHNISGEELHLIIQSSLSRDYDYANTQGKHHDHSGNSKIKAILMSLCVHAKARSYQEATISKSTQKILISDVSLVLGQRVQARPIWRWHVR